MPSLEPILPHVLPLALVVARLTGIFLFTPMLSSISVPMMWRALLAFMFAVAIYPFVPPMPGAASLDVFQLAPLLFGELLIGTVIGLLAGLPLIAVQMGGYVMGYLMGLSLAESFNPELEANGSAIGDALYYMAALVFIGVGGLEVLFATLAHSFTTAPVGLFSAVDLPLDLLLGVMTSGFELAIRVSAPVMAVVMLQLLSMGFVMKTMPQINIMSIGFAAQIIAGLAILLVSIGIIATVSGDEIDSVLDQITGWVHQLAPRPVPASAVGVPHG